MRFKTGLLVILGLGCACALVGTGSAQESQRSYDAAFFERFAPQTALEMVARVPGFILEDADEERGLSQGGTNVLVNGRPITGKGETAATQIAQIAAANVVRMEVIDAGTLDLPGFSGIVLNIVTQRSTIAGSWLWEPQWRARNEAATGNGNITVSGSRGKIDFTAAFDALMVRAGFFGPETLTNADGAVFETRDESLVIRGEQPELSGSIRWRQSEDQILNAKASIDRLNVNRPQISRTMAVGPRGVDSLNTAINGQDQTNFRFDTDYTFPVFGGALKLIGFADIQDADASTRLAIVDGDGIRISSRRFDEQSVRQEGVLRFEQNWEVRKGRSWQLGGEAVYNALDLETQFREFSVADPLEVVFQSDLDTKIEEARGEVTIAHRRRLSPKLDLQTSIGAEASTIKQGTVERDFFRPKGFVSLNATPTKDWTLTGRVSREVGQIDFRDFAASVSLFEEVVRENNPALVPQQNWAFQARAERRFRGGHVASLEGRHELITDLVDRIPLGAEGDAIGNIDEARRTRLTAVATLLGAPIGLSGAQLDLRGVWQWSSLEDPIEGFDRDIADLRTLDLRAEFRHDIENTQWACGGVLRTQNIAPLYQSTLVRFRNIPGGGLTPGENTLFIEHKDVFGLRIRAELSEFLEQEADFSRVIYAGRRDVSPIDRIETRSRDLDGPILTLSIGGTF